MTPEQFEDRVEALKNSHKILANFPIDNIKEALTDNDMFGPQKAQQAIKQFLTLYQAMFMAFKDIEQTENLDLEQKEIIIHLRENVEQDLYRHLEDFKRIAQNADIAMPEHLLKLIPETEASE